MRRRRNRAYLVRLRRLAGDYHSGRAFIETPPDPKGLLEPFQDLPMHTHPFCDFEVTRLRVTRFFPVFQSGEKSCNAALTARVHWGFPTPPLYDGFGWHRLGSDQIRPEWGQRLAGQIQRGGDQAVWHRGASGPRRAARHGSTEGTGVAAVAARLGCRCGAAGELLCSGGLLRLWCHSPNRGETGQCGGRGSRYPAPRPAPSTQLALGAS